MCSAARFCKHINMFLAYPSMNYWVMHFWLMKFTYWFLGSALSSLLPARALYHSFWVRCSIYMSVLALCPIHTRLWGSVLHRCEFIGSLSHLHKCIGSVLTVSVAVVLLVSTEPLGELCAVPDQQLLAGLHGPHGVEEHLLAVLTGHQVLLRQRPRRIHEAHPVAFLHVFAVDEVVELAASVDLGEEREGGEEDEFACSGTGLDLDER